MKNEKQVEGNPKEFGSDDFFDAMDRQVNGAIMDDQPIEATPQNTAGPTQATQQQNIEGTSTNDVDWEKRYKDSSREAVKMREQINELKPFVPVLEAMKRDSGLVDHVRNYLVEGGKPSKSVKEQLGLDEDFIYDESDAMGNPDSDSAKVFNAHVDRLVQNRVGGILDDERKRSLQARAKMAKQREIMDFKNRHEFTDEQVQEIIGQAQQRRMTLDDMYYLLNRDKASANVARSTKQDMMEQMKNVRNIPTSAGGVNSPRAEVSADDQAFDSIMGSDVDFDDLFGG
ncbi:MAG: hypothetical protein GOVbin2066_49 [Prokaryotic dsDNA virus sp.]|nr:MAG: hypothetical protein GOVbin2066_49 [Prokaryotic dsDNA virus sp.]|tara:strand:+ start:1612 stop:2469 length:858 start_codon:yes stop_codon:yes gene_type:complete